MNDELVLELLKEVRDKLEDHGGQINALRQEVQNYKVRWETVDKTLRIVGGLLFALLTLNLTDVTTLWHKLFG